MKFELVPEGVVNVLNQPSAVAFISGMANKAAAAAVQAAPVGQAAPHYRDTIISTPAEPSPQGAKASFGSTSSVWHIIEYGSVNNPPYRPLTRGAMNAGLDVREQPQ